MAICREIGRQGEEAGLDGSDAHQSLCVGIHSRTQSRNSIIRDGGAELSTRSASRLLVVFVSDRHTDVGSIVFAVCFVTDLFN